MAFDTSQLRSPFFRVKIGGPDGQKLIDLPPSVARLIDSFEYHEIVDGSKASASRITLKFIEGSKAGLDVPGSILDLQFSASSGITSLKTTEISERKDIATKDRVSEEKPNTAQAITGPTKSGKNIDDGLAEDLKKKQDIKNQQSKKDKALFLLQERNIVEVTWGYRSPKSFKDLDVRTARGAIQKITHRASGDSMPITDILITDAGSGEFAKQEPDVGVSFTIEYVKKKLAGTDLLSDYAETIQKDHAPARVDDIVRTIAELIGDVEANVQLTDEELDLDVQDLSSARPWPQGTNLHEFLKGLAEKLNAHYYVSTNTLTNKTRINLISRTFFEGNITKHFVWKGGSANKPSNLIPYRTLKTYSISIFPEGGEGGASIGVDSKKKIITGAAEVKIKVTSEKPTDLSMTNSDPQISNSTSGSAKTTYGESSDKNDHKAKATNMAGRMDKGLRLDFTTIGIPSLAPSIIKVSNIGLRYSGLYYALSVTHRISATNGYTCDVLANTNAVASGGVNVQGTSTKAVAPAESTQVTGVSTEDITPGDRTPAPNKVDGQK